MNLVSNISTVNFKNYNFSSSVYQQQSINNTNLNIYNRDTFKFQNNIVLNDPYEKPIPIPENPEYPEPEKPSFFNRPEVRLAGMTLGASAIGGAIGAGIGHMAGRVAVGAAIGAGVGALAPIALLAYALYSFN